MQASHKCYRCKKIQPIDNYNMRGNCIRYKSCILCRTKIVPTDEHVSQTPDATPPPDDDTDPTSKCLAILENYGYRPLKFNQTFLDDVVAEGVRTQYCIQMLYDNHLAMKIDKFDTPAFIFCVDPDTLVILKVDKLNILDRYIAAVQLEGLNMCDICNETNTNCFKECSRCNNRWCCKCFQKMTAIKMQCPFCRYDIKTHVLAKMTELNIDIREAFHLTLKKNVHI